MVNDPEKQALLAWGFDTWQQSESKLESLPWQFIHGDMNPENILVRGDQVTGLVDFGDSCFNPVICDLAICLPYMMMDRSDPLEAAVAVTRAYHEIRPLTEAELCVLYSLICGRLATTIAVSTKRRLIDPDNPNWFGEEESTWSLLEQLNMRRQALNRLRLPGSVVFFRLVVLLQLLLHRVRHRVVVAEFHREATLALAHALELGVVVAE